MSEDALALWTIYRSPRDAPGKWVVRRWRVVPGLLDPVPDEASTAHDSLEQARAVVPAGLVMFARAPGDDPVVVETWL